MFTVVRRFRVSLAVAVLSLLSSSVRADESVARPDASQSATLQFSPEVRTHVDRMLAQSPTFRSQYQRVAAHGSLVVAAVLDPTLNHRTFGARSTIRRYTTGLVVVQIAIAPGSHVDEYIAHEFEHVLEELEGVRLTELARRGAAGIWFSGENLIETNRATRAGRAVTDEMRARDRRPDNLVQ
jgi:hypothetical protein